VPRPAAGVLNLLAYAGSPPFRSNPSVLSCPTVIIPQASTDAGWGAEISNVQGIGLLPNSHRGLSERIGSHRRSVSGGAQRPRAAPPPVATRAGCPDRPRSRLRATRPRHPLLPLDPHVRCFSALPPSHPGRSVARFCARPLFFSTFEGHSLYLL